jgi:hypothetical protein
MSNSMRPRVTKVVIEGPEGQEKLVLLLSAANISNMLSESVNGASGQDDSVATRFCSIEPSNAII